MIHLNIRMQILEGITIKENILMLEEEIFGKENWLIGLTDQGHEGR